MARSRRHTPIFGMTFAESEKEDKRRANRLLRRKTRAVLRPETDVEEVQLPAIKEVSNPWSMAKDGRRYLQEPKPRDMRK